MLLNVELKCKIAKKGKKTCFCVAKIQMYILRELVVFHFEISFLSKKKVVKEAKFNQLITGER